MTGTKFDRYVFIVFENTNASKALADPNFKALLSKGRYFSKYQATSHPSEPNYISLVAGSNFSIANDNVYDLPDATRPTATSTIVDLLEAKGISWKIYSEGQGTNAASPGCVTVASVGSKCTYARKHQPFMSFKANSNNTARCAKQVDASNFATDIKNNALPQYVWFVPNQCNDGHDTTITFAGSYLASWMTNFTTLAGFTTGTTLLHIAFDENDNSAGNYVYSLIVPFVSGTNKATNIIAGTIDTSAYTHFSTLAAIENNWGLGNLGRGDATAIPLLL